MGINNGSVPVPRHTADAQSSDSNLDCLRSMRAVDLAYFLNRVETDGRCGCLRGVNGWLAWLNQGSQTSDYKYRCRDCKWLDLNQKSSIGYLCTNPNIQHSRMGHMKYTWSPACRRGFEPREVGEEAPVL